MIILRIYLLISLTWLGLLVSAAEIQRRDSVRKPVESELSALKIGEIQPRGWLYSQLINQRNGLTGHLDEFWDEISKSAWLGFNGSVGENTPYYMNGLIPLAFILNDDILIEKTTRYVEFILNSQKANGWFGPEQNNDTWPLTLALKGLMSYYDASSDQRVLDLMTRYFHYLYSVKPEWEEGTWPGMRAMEIGIPALWLYKQTGDNISIKVLNEIKANSFDWTELFKNFPYNTKALEKGSIPRVRHGEGMQAHLVNLVMALKYPAISFAISSNNNEISSINNVLKELDQHHGQLGGRFSGDDHLSGTSPDRGTELCTIVDEMYSIEKIIEILGDHSFADRLEALAFNALPACISSDFWSHQYNQQTNQVVISAKDRPWTSTGSHSNLFGLMPNYPSCLVNMHQGWPKYVQHLWMQTKDNGLMAISYSPCKISTKLKCGNKIQLNVITNYPFGNKIKIKIESADSYSFPVYLRIPNWAINSTIKIGTKVFHPKAGSLQRLEESWSANNEIEVTFPMVVRTEKRFNESISVLKGPLYYALNVGSQYKQITLEDRFSKSIPYMGSVDWEIFPTTQWQYGLLVKDNQLINVSEIQTNPLSRYPFSRKGEQVYNEADKRYYPLTTESPNKIFVEACLIDNWALKNNSAAIPPKTIIRKNNKSTFIELIPYGCTRLRIAEFPHIKQ